ncbi:ATP-binding cassette domain-containing protein [Caenispirillum bisanense]|uniref:ABC-2 type transport system ATP-binding protein n=1 Tax=Caenispirillum bisanense TaxID=414052 RepID=A0A286GEE8_9PROT|nr:ATP-binding cassette domain-containing protein [Caenispirillum bisanense]SOD93606.1 ABC-2 type transport system ATP-binding protein [Caenispirillum bisanense]
MAAASDPLVVLRGVVKRFGRTAVVDGLDLAVAPGGVTAVVGPDGAGKTTLLRLMAGLLAPDAGTVTVCGHDTIAEPEAARADLGYMPQRFGLYQDLSVAENLALHADLQGLPPADRPVVFERLLAFTGLAPFTGRLAGKLSGGMKQKLGLACVLIRKPRVLLLDEPTVGVDPVSRRDLWAMVQALRDDGTAVVWSTSYLDEAERCETVVVLDGGRVRFAGPPADLTAQVAGRTHVVEGLSGDRRRIQRRANALPAVVDALIQGPAVRLVLAEGAAPPAAEALGDSAAQVVPVPPRLEDAFVALLAPARPAVPGVRLDVRVGKGAADAIAVHDLTRRFGDFVAADRVTFSVPRGEVFGLLGPNGAGKSTTFRMLCGLLPASGGTARVAGFDLGRAAPAARARIGYVAQKFSLYEALTGRQNLAFFGGVYGLGRRALAEAVARVAGGLHLDAALDATVADMPLGIKQRLAVACAVLHGPEILFLDEPTSGVDPLTRREFWRHINGLAEDGVTVMVTTHFLDEAEYCDRVALMDAGRVIALGPPEDLKAAHRTAEVPEPTLEDAFIAAIAAERRETPP